MCRCHMEADCSVQLSPRCHMEADWSVQLSLRCHMVIASSITHRSPYKVGL